MSQPSAGSPGGAPGTRRGRAEEASVFVCTYEAEAELELVLAGLARQSSLPGEVWVADDGSGPGTRALVERFAADFPCTLQQVRHEDRGCRRSGIVNQAVAQAGGSHLLFLDGDTVPHRHWLRDHLARAATGERQALCGRRVRLGPEYTRRFTRERLERGDFDGMPPWDMLKSALRGDTRRLEMGVRLPLFAQRLMHIKRDKHLMGCNFSLPRAAFEEVDGFDEAWPGSALLSDDWDLEVRLRKAGWRMEPMLHTAVTFHLHHPPRVQGAEETELRRQRAAEAPLRAERGLSSRL